MLVIELYLLRSSTYRSSKSGTWIPSLGDWESSSAAGIGPTTDNVGEALVALAVQPGIQESERRFARRDQSIIYEGEDTRHQWAGSTCSGNGAFSKVANVGEVKALGCEIGITSAI